MSQATSIIKSFQVNASTAILGNRICRLSTSSGVAVATTAASATETSIGVSSQPGAPISGQVDLTISGIATVVMGEASTAAGVLLTSDSTGRAVTAASTNRAIGILLEPNTGVGQLCQILVVPHLA